MNVGRVTLLVVANLGVLVTGPGPRLNTENLAGACCNGKVRSFVSIPPHFLPSTAVSVGVWSLVGSRVGCRSTPCPVTGRANEPRVGFGSNVDPGRSSVDHGRVCPDHPV